MPKKKPEDTPTEAIPVGTKFDYKPVWMGYIHPNKLGAKDKNGLPYGIPDTMGKEVDNFEALLDEFGAAGYEPCLQVAFRSGDAYLIFKREKVG